MNDEEEAAFRSELEKLGEAQVHVNVERRVYQGLHKAAAILWLKEREITRTAYREERADKALAAAERSAMAAEGAAKGSRDTARWTMLIAFATFLAVLATLGTAILQWLSGRGA